MATHDVSRGLVVWYHLTMPFATKVERNELAQAIWGLRASSGMKQQELAARLGISTTTIGRLEKNSEPTWPVLDGLAKIAREKNLPKLAKVFDCKLATRRKEDTPAIDKLLENEVIKRMPEETVLEVLDVVRQLVGRLNKSPLGGEWDKTEPAERTSNRGSEFEEYSRRLQNLVNPYIGKGNKRPSG